MPRPQQVKGGPYNGTGKTGRIRPTEGPFERLQDRNKPEPLTDAELVTTAGLLRTINDQIRQGFDVTDPEEYKLTEQALVPYLQRMTPEEIAALEEAIHEIDSATTPSQERPYGWDPSMGPRPWTEEPYGSNI